MGTDIHMFMQWWDAKEKKWRPFNAEPDPNGEFTSWGLYTEEPTPMEMLAGGLADHAQEHGYSWNFTRNYDAFAQLAGVRDTGAKGRTRIWETRGVPHDCTESIWGILHEEIEVDASGASKRVWYGRSPVAMYGKHWLRSPDYHSHSWLMARELAEQEENLNVQLHELLLEIRHLASERSIKFESIRILFWFDN